MKKTIIALILSSFYLVACNGKGTDEHGHAHDHGDHDHPHVDHDHHDDRDMLHEQEEFVVGNDTIETSYGHDHNHPH